MKGMKKKQIKDKHQPIDKLRKRRLFNADDDRGSSSVSSSPLKRSTRSTGSIIDPLKKSSSARSSSNRRASRNSKSVNYSNKLRKRVQQDPEEESSVSDASSDISIRSSSATSVRDSDEELNVVDTDEEVQEAKKTSNDDADDLYDDEEEDLEPKKTTKKTNKKKTVKRSESNDNEMSNNNSHSSQSNTQIQQQYLQTQRNIEITFENKLYNLDTFEKLGFIYNEDLKPEELSALNLVSSKPQLIQPPQLPKVNIEILKDAPICYEEYKQVPNYIKFIEKTVEELDEEIEYDMDEEDNVWLKLINEQRSTNGQIQVTQEQFELLMDRLEKESYFQSSTSTTSVTTNAQTTDSENNQVANCSSNSLNTSKTNPNDSNNEDALCCICLDGECINSNVILFCDMCNLAIHQECYGVPYIPEGQWLCRRCIQSPSTPVDCILCPNRYGAFKQTDQGQWAHVVCAIWIPEVHFANTVFLEPIIGIENIDKARWKLMCYICRKKNAGACIQCDKLNCFTAFHVTCAQQAGLYMNIQEEVAEMAPAPRSTSVRKKKNGNQRHRKSTNVNLSPTGSVGGEVRKCAYCHIHTPLEVLSPKTRKQLSSFVPNSAECEEALKRAQKIRMKKARKILAEKRNAPPVICLPVIPQERKQDILNRLGDDPLDEKEVFFEKLMNYWLLKRYSRNGVPLLRRLQSSAVLKKNSNDVTLKTEPTDEKVETETDLDTAKKEIEQMKDQLANMKKIRQDLERARLLMEMIRKRERLKKENIRVHQLITCYEINPFNCIFLQRILDLLAELDKQRIFTQPVNAEEVPSYYEEIKSPMDFSTMQIKLNRHEYSSLIQFEQDLNLIVNNCLTFNQKNSYYYKAACKLREQASSLFKQARKLYDNALFDKEFLIKLESIEQLANTNKVNDAQIKTDSIDEKPII